LCRLAPLRHVESDLNFLDWLESRYSTGELKPQLNAQMKIGTEGPYLVLAPGATWTAKEWPLSKWLDLVVALLEVPGPSIKILAPPGREDEWARPWAENKNTRLEVMPSMSLADVKNRLANAAGLITVDGGVMHMAVALGIPTLAIFGPTDPDIWFPYEKMGPYRVLALKPECHPCHRHQCDEFICLPELATGQVFQAAQELFGFNWGAASEVVP